MLEWLKMNVAEDRYLMRTYNLNFNINSAVLKQYILSVHDDNDFCWEFKI